MSAYELVVIGGGEAGISAALRATQLGAKVCLINREPELGGGCVQTGTLPSKTLSNAAHFLENLKKGKRYGIPVVEGAKADYKTILESRHKTTMCEVGILASLIRKNAIETLTGIASFKGPRSVKGRAFGSPLARGLYPRASTAEVDPRVKPGAGLPSPGPGKAGAPAAVEVRLLDGTVHAFEAPKTVIATGSRPVALPGLPFDGKTVLSPDDLPALDAVPGRFLIVGAGVIGCEMAFIFRSLGSEVVVVEKAERALLGQDHDVATLITREFKKRGIRLLVQTGLERVETAADGHVRAFLAGAETVEAD
ncbi:MAG: NAD(P)/FAD-dependent oxidoreductase, partial [Acidobacteria bacterium]|nr:NAD(P)/FAD-dependent oxidoreductase [Acidobacteriota bacterium]